MLQAKTKIIATLGPSSATEEIIERLVMAGMDIARLNFSHGTPEIHLDVATKVRTVSDRLGRHIAIFADLPGPKIRTGDVADPNGVLLIAGTDVRLAYDPEVHTTPERITTSYQFLGVDVRPGHQVLLDDGSIELVVHSIVSDTEILCTVKTGGILKSHKGINFPSTILRIPTLTDHDKEIVRFAIQKIGVDALALSFVRKAEDIRELRQFLKDEFGDTSTPLIAKIEKPEAVENIKDILAETDMIMVARGDLGVEMPLERVPPIQKRLVDLANARGVPVITATQMLESMIAHPRPTRAEASDVANAVFDGSDCVMLSAETGAGSYPVESVATMREIILAAERSGYVRVERDFVLPQDEVEYATDSVARAACVLAEEVNAQAIISATLSGRSARYVAKYRYSKMVIGMSTDDSALRRMAFYHGVIPMKLEQVGTFDETLDRMISDAQARGLIGTTGWVVLTAGHPIFQVSHTNIVKVHLLG
ncbi:MAG: pyruvate kinase [Bacteroidota bacterium]|nr:pyruvate kinase [Bacteroidota bacterium]MDP4233960.1 pyruvate kinase [Bacteroidota bacterium]MDP4242789.1 pyruvate kinase [Bacteroidota bacterium]MDP4288503.1 pyruvate kinase [Bacteroidota bacterium]